ncbi:MAG: HAMP domain-containing sensor histidine kinase [Bacilli bacterium]|nr:HAMP domain-containing sensor histidine kinase [Bacilli bacterium]
MKNKNLSLIFKIAFMVFIAFVVVLGNEMRIGRNRYMKNTLETDAASNARMLEKIEKVYIEDSLNNGKKMQSDIFLSTYESFLEDSSKIKCLTDKEGNIIDISRQGFDTPVLHILKEADNMKQPVYFDLTSLHQEALSSLKMYLLNHKEKDVEIKIVFIDEEEGQEEILHFSNIKIKELYVDNRKLYINTKLIGETKTYSGPIGYFSDIDYEMLYESENILTKNIYDGLDGEIVSEKVVIYDYSSMRENLEYKIENNFYDFVSSKQNVMNTNYSQYYLLDLIEDKEDSSLSYSTTMCKFIDWYSVEDETANDLDELEDKATEGYCFIVQKYNHLSLNATTQFMMDNVTTYSLTVLLMGLICIGLGYFIIYPIRKIERAAQSITEKDFTIKLRSNRHDEIGSLARSINSMSSELEKTINDLYLEIEHVKQLEDLRKEFVSNFTHEIKTPLGIISGFSELIEIEEDEEKRNEYINIIQQETRKINQLVLAMLDLSKLESKNITLNMIDLNIVDLCEDILETMAVHIYNKKIIIEKDFHDCTINADYQKIEMTITNLISNAIRYTNDNGHIYITINDIGFYIENEGQPIAEEELSKIWLPFQKADKSRNDEGTGLGLSIVKAALDLHGMKYGAQNTAKGVLFYFEYNRRNMELK